MKITYTKHAEAKFNDLAVLGIKVNKNIIKSIISNPNNVDATSDAPNKIVSGRLDERRILRVVCRKEDAIMVIITFYPAKKGRYFI